MKVIDLVGRKFGKLTVIVRQGSDKHGLAQWECLCDCGRLKVFRGSALRSGNAKSCGCSQYDKQTKHSMCDSRIYNIWKGMKTRCNNPNRTTADSYYFTGITYSPSWEEFDAFFSDMGNGYDDTMELDRIDNEKGYYKENCRWVPSDQQVKNRMMFKTNKTGVTGTCIVKMRKTAYLSAYIGNGNGCKIRKYFSLNKYSIDEALNLASLWRKEMELKLGYDENHGRKRGEYEK